LKSAASYAEAIYEWANSNLRIIILVGDFLLTTQRVVQKMAEVVNSFGRNHLI
jgi:hypothetical protein